MDADAIVVGGGPAGAAAAIALAAAGGRVVVFGRPPTGGDRAGESLSPGALALLARLGVRARFLDDGHRVCHANASAWGGPDLAWHDFVRDPRGPGFHVDRPRFEAMLRDRAIEAGARWIATSAPRIVRAGDAWQIAASPAITARRVVDASGRAATVARALGARRCVAWAQVALIAFAHAVRPIDETFSLVEAVRDGFWYSAPIPGDRLALALFTDADLHDARRARGRDGFDALLAAAPHTRARFAAHAAALATAPRFVGAGSGWLTPVHGPGWIAAGDAALTYDPISAHGLTLALRTGIGAADAVLAGTDAALAGYAARLTRGFHDYRAAALRIYRAEQRWTDAPYWRRRHALSA
jgi:flavin-dependent dehydrogenase